MVSTSKSDAQADFERGATLQKAGRFLDARATFLKLLETHPNHGAAHFQIANIDFASGDPESAIPHLAQARKSAPGQPPVWQLSILCVGATDNVAEINALATSLKSAPLPAKVKSSLLRLMTNNRPANFGAAPKQKVQQLIKALVSGDVETALPLSRELSAAFPNAAHLQNTRAAAEILASHEALAISLFRKAVLLDPYSASIRLNFGQNLVKMGEYSTALRHLRRADQLAPNTAQILAAIADAILQDKARYSELEEAHNLAKRAAQLDPENHYIQLVLAQSHAQNDDTDTARAQLRALLDVPSASIRASKLLSELELSAGNFEVVSELLHKTVQDTPDRLEAYYTLSMAKSFAEDDPLIPIMEDLCARDDISAHQKIPVYFSVAKALEDSKQYGKVFHYLKKANDSMLESYGFSKDEVEGRFDRIRRIAETSDLQTVMQGNARRDNPILITGMPRSGTTLTERIFGSHSTVTPAGEAIWSSSALSRLLSDPAAKLDDSNWINLELQRAGTDYINDARQMIDPCQRIADKTILNHEVIGLLKAAMPESTIVVLKRDPRDNILSIYKNRFQPNSVKFNTSLRNAAYYYSVFERYLAYWNEVFSGSFVELSYDSLTQNPEGEMKALFKVADLEWEDGVLMFHEKAGNVRTLSTFQVRKPIYTSSVRSWERYEADLRPLLDALDEFGVSLPD